MAQHATSTVLFDVRVFGTSSSVRRALDSTRRGLSAANGLSKNEFLLKAAVGQTPAETFSVNVTSVFYARSTQPFSTEVTRTPAQGQPVTYTERHSTLCLLTLSAGVGETITIVIRPTTSVDAHVVAVSA